MPVLETARVENPNDDGAAIGRDPEEPLRDCVENERPDEQPEWLEPIGGVGLTLVIAGLASIVPVVTLLFIRI